MSLSLVPVSKADGPYRSLARQDAAPGASVQITPKLAPRDSSVNPVNPGWLEHPMPAFSGSKSRLPSRTRPVQKVSQKPSASRSRAGKQVLGPDSSAEPPAATGWWRGLSGGMLGGLLGGWGAWRILRNSRQQQGRPDKRKPTPKWAQMFVGVGVLLALGIGFLVMGAGVETGFLGNSWVLTFLTPVGAIFVGVGLIILIALIVKYVQWLNETREERREKREKKKEEREKRREDRKKAREARQEARENLTPAGTGESAPPEEAPNPAPAPAQETAPTQAPTQAPTDEPPTVEPPLRQPTPNRFNISPSNNPGEGNGVPSEAGQPAGVTPAPSEPLPRGN